MAGLAIVALAAFLGVSFHVLIQEVWQSIACPEGRSIMGAPTELGELDCQGGHAPFWEYGIMVILMTATGALAWYYDLVSPN